MDEDQIAMIRPEIQEFKLDRVFYRLVLPKDGNGGSIALHLVGGYAPRVGDLRRAREEYDPFQRWEDYDPDDFFLVGDEDLGVNVFTLARACLKRIEGWIAREHPGYFLFSSSTDRKQPLYDRFAKILLRRIEKKHYSYQKLGKGHYFFRTGNQYANKNQPVTQVAER